MKWKCTKCSYGPCVYQTAGYSKMLMDTRCFNDMDMENTKANWIPMSDEEPEQKEESGLPEWLKVGNFVWLDATTVIVNGDAESHKGVYRIENIEKRFLLVLKKRGDEDVVQLACSGLETLRRIKMHQVFPRPYTFETAPVAFKVRRKADGMNAILDLGCRNDGFQEFAIIAPGFGARFVSFADALRVYEQLDGWPCGTFDEEG